MKRLLFALLAAIAILLPTRAPADGWDANAYYTVYTDAGDELFTFAGDMEKGDEYISADNQCYVVQSVDENAKKAMAVHQGTQQLPNVSWIETSAAVPVSASGNAGNEDGKSDKMIAMYSTHSDESYKPTDGVDAAEDGKGGIYDVGRALKKALEDKGIAVELDETIHAPHDSGAYRRSRQTAVDLLKKGPDAIIDVHRDGIPNPEEYQVTIDGQDASKVRLLVGRSNQNAEANKQFALELKAVADKKYPELIKDIYIGKGSYNQDLMSNAILLEMGTHTIDKDRAIVSAHLMSNVISDTLYGGVSGAAGDNQSAASRGAGSGIIWLIIILAVVVGVYAFLQTGNGKVAWEKIKRNTSELTVGLIGKRPDKDKK